MYLLYTLFVVWLCGGCVGHVNKSKKLELLKDTLNFVHSDGKSKSHSLKSHQDIQPASSDFRNLKNHQKSLYPRRNSQNLRKHFELQEAFSDYPKMYKHLELPWPSNVPLHYQSKHEPIQSSTDSLSFHNHHELKKSSGDHRPLLSSSVSRQVVNQQETSQRFKYALRKGSRTTTESFCPARCHCKYRSDKTVDVVDCSNKGLKEIANLPTTCRMVFLQNNDISDIFYHQFRNLGLLQVLDLSGNSLRKIRNDTFQDLNSLVSLSLHENKLHYIPGTFEVGAFRGLISLESLHIEGNQPSISENFTYPDQALSYVPTLRYLWLDGYPRPLGPGFSYLRNLSKIGFGSGVRTGRFCYMGSDIPRDFFLHIATTQPLSVYMSHCRISAIGPDVFKYLPTIYTLDLCLNEDLSIDGFEKASEGLKNSNLTELNISYTETPENGHRLIRNTTFRNLKNTTLKVLVVEKCKLTTIDPQAILDLPQTMQFISFARNFLDSGSSFWALSLIHLKNLNTVVAADQNSPNIKNTHRLLFLQTNATIKAQGSIQMSNPLFFHDGLQNEREQLISDVLKFSRHKEQNLNSIPVPIPLPQKLQSVYARHVLQGYSAVITYPISIVNNEVVKYVDMSFIGIKSFTSFVYGVPSLQYFDFSDNECEYVNPLVLSQTPSITTLLLHNNRFGRVLKNDAEGVILSFSILLETLDLSDNDIDDLSEKTFHNNKNLKTLNLSSNALSHFRPSLSNNTELELLDLSFNQLEGFSESTCRQMLEIKTRNPKFIVKIKENKFICSCDNLYFLEFLLDHPSIFEDVNLFSCEEAGHGIVMYAGLEQFLPQFSIKCVVQSIFVYVLVLFFCMIGTISVCALYYFKRWQWKYLYYLSKSRLHIGSMYVTFRPVAHIFVTYDQVRSNLYLPASFKLVQAH